MTVLYIEKLFKRAKKNFDFFCSYQQPFDETLVFQWEYNGV